MAAGAHYDLVLAGIVRGALAELDGLPEEVLNRPVPLEEANSLYALATHLLGSTEFWVLQMGAGHDVKRDRDAEFHAHGSYADLAARAGRLIASLHDAVPGLTASDLDAPGHGDRRPSMLPEGQPVTVRDCLLHAIEHSGLHLGQIQITRQLLVEGFAARS
ncbi:MAG TPA: DinB family protein [Thermomicrobiaceae bacterium]|nr:DinB family protein [Thermomicrobiaceae bacterium]